MSAPLCECGCGRPTNVARRSVPSRGIRKGDYYRFLRGHGTRAQKRSNRWKGGRVVRRGYLRVWMPEHPRASDGYVMEHILVASEALGRPVPLGNPVHHVNGIRSDNRRRNLVLCEDSAYHRLLHYRQDALNACGDADAMYCQYCKAWDKPEAMYVRPGRHQAYHRACQRTSQRAAYERRKAA